MIRDDYLNPEVKKQIDKFNDNLYKRLEDTKFLLEDSPHFADLDYDDDNHNHGVITNHGITPSDDEYGDMLTDDRPEADNEEAIDKYLICELVMDVGSGNEQKGRVTKRSRGHGGELVLRKTTRSLTPKNVKLNSQMAQSKSMLPTLLLRTCLHRLIMKADIT